MRHTLVALSLSCALGAVGALAALGCNDNKRDRPVDAGPPPPPTDAVAGAVPDPVKDFASTMIDEGRKTFRFDTFGDEAFWGTSLQLNRAVAGSANGGVGGRGRAAPPRGVPLRERRTAGAGALRKASIDALSEGQVNLDDAATTL